MREDLEPDLSVPSLGQYFGGFDDTAVIFRARMRVYDHTDDVFINQTSLPSSGTSAIHMHTPLLQDEQNAVTFFSADLPQRGVTLLQSSRNVFLALFTAGLLCSCGGQSEPTPTSMLPRLLAAVTTSTITFSGPRANYAITSNETGFKVTEVSSGLVTAVVFGALLNFTDLSVRLDMRELSTPLSSSELDRLIELYIAFFNRVPEADGLAYWIAELAKGTSQTQIAESFYAAGVANATQTGYSANMTAADFVRKIYENVLGRSGASAPTDAEVAYWTNELSKGTMTRGSLVASMLSAARGFANDATWSWVSTLLDNKVIIGRVVGLEQGLTWLSTDVSLKRTMDIAAAVTPTSVSAARSLVGVDDTFNMLDVTALPLGEFRGNVVLGSPTTNSIRANVFSPDQSGSIGIVYGRTSGVYLQQTGTTALAAAVPVEIALTGLSADTTYYYRLSYQKAGGSLGYMEEASFHTARPAGSSFSFGIQGDSHPERPQQFDSALYSRTLQMAAADKPDFYILSGDDFSVDTLDAKTVTAAQVTERYTIQRPYLGLIGRSAPVYLVNGNHEQAARYLLDGTANNVAVWAQTARNKHYSQPATDGFYSGNTELVPNIGLLRNYYAWTWGDALFVVIDPYWSSPGAVDNIFGSDAKRTSLWEVTHGDAQYAWLKAALESSKAKYKFVFAHHVMGSQRGGVEVARLWEWGGENAKGVNEFAVRRPGWAMPIHQLMVANKVTIFFQGHDHVWAHQQLDGIRYQTLSEPADPSYALYFPESYTSGDRFPNSGYTRVKVTPNGVTVEYVRMWRKEDEGPDKQSGSVAFRYTIP